MSKDSRYRALPDDASLHPPRVGRSNDCPATERRATQASTHPVWVEQRLSS